jgi:diguanylate cyclase (GGDEF)-like protein
VAERVLIADDDPGVATAVQVNLELEGYEVFIATNGRDTLEQALKLRPDLVLLDVLMPDLDGFEVCRKLRGDPRLLNCPVILVTAKGLTDDKVRGFAAGADDYIVKPFDPAEMIARVRAVLRRSSQMRDLSPLTRLPGNFHIARELERLVSEPDPHFAVIYADLNDFKSFNDHYGFLRGDQVIMMTARVLTDALAEHGGERTFAGHVGGDDFILVCDEDAPEAFCKSAIAAFDEQIVDLYDPADVEAGGVVVENRRGEVTRYGIVSLALGVATTANGSIGTRWEASSVASEMKSHAKAAGASAYAIDRRAG